MSQTPSCCENVATAKEEDASQRHQARATWNRSRLIKHTVFVFSCNAGIFVLGCTQAYGVFLRVFMYRYYMILYNIIYIYNNIYNIYNI